jgi:hypothetical protein
LKLRIHRLAVAESITRLTITSRAASDSEPSWTTLTRSTLLGNPSLLQTVQVHGELVRVLDVEQPPPREGKIELGLDLEKLPDCGLDLVPFLQVSKGGDPVGEAKVVAIRDERALSRPLRSLIESAARTGAPVRGRKETPPSPIAIIQMQWVTLARHSVHLFDPLAPSKRSSSRSNALNNSPP